MRIRCVDLTVGGVIHGGKYVETFTTSYNTILKAMQNKFGVENIIYEPGVTYAEKEEWYVENTPEIEKVIEKAGAADYIMVCIGENSYAGDNRQYK